MSTKTILLVDDDEDDLMLLKEAIRNFDQSYNFAESRDGLAALNYLKTLREADDQPCLVVLDINMPVLDGREVLAILKNDPGFKKIPIVVFTTSSNPADKAYCSQFGVELITKPFDMPQLLEKARQILSFCA